MKSFRFQQFEMLQNANVFRIGTDAVLLGALANVSYAENILEVGTGTGIISLMLAQRNPSAIILAIDINPEAAKLSSVNFSRSPFSKRLKSQIQDFKNFETQEKFDLIISNPPYFEINPSQKDAIARQKLELDFSDLIHKSVAVLSENGQLSVIIPVNYQEELIQICSKNRLFLQKKITIKGIETSEPKRVILEFSFTDKNIIEKLFVIEKSPRVFSDEYLQLTKDFHLFSD